ncbi:5'-methylthioadenosine/S-adenosylhomocysteine nucleosidase [Novosphingobium sp. ERN07]|uniref:5'-methylthioadenosine/S-adenosylhomocysteine nucleosidase family protein n=1 Tax=Novosphingobium sp. ERN07 TaxID=2726187 RepID=UPI0014573307|nr:5'-methylthioadenosine/S-adenosylhomocysteine nucleosidase [Novosphingobium sp. ERN07]NLR72834.1 5'-methylthioadenosine/S-adenosylhomocysteine nucleosidase [Novosphingobium sp. ERN07]
MRRNIFLHFLNRDTREVFDFYGSLQRQSHSGLLRQALNAAAILCEDHCIAPPGFIVEDELAFELAESQRAFLREGLIQFPMRENSLAEFAEKKRIGYEPMRDRYSGLFNDTRIGFLGDNAKGIISRKTLITEGILNDWTSGPESGARMWAPIKKRLTHDLVDIVSKIPAALHEKGMALTWSAIEPELPEPARAAAKEMRDTLQHVYFRQYCIEFGLIALNGIPHVLHDFNIPADTKVYNYRRLSSFLDIFEMRELLYEAPADLIVSLRRQPGFISFMDAFAAFAKSAGSETDIKFHAGRAAQGVSYGWETLKSRRLSFYEGSPVEIRELCDALAEVSSHLVKEHGLPVRGQRIISPNTNKRVPGMSNQPELVLFVALAEELDVLAKSLGFDKPAGTPEATGKLDGYDVAVICPRAMGRVAGAVAMADYLARRPKPKLILIVGLAGGFQNNNSKPGHIVVATKVVDLALRKVVDEADAAITHFRHEDYVMDDVLQRHIQSDEFDKKAWVNQACELGWPDDQRPSIHYGPLASADEVVASNEWSAQILNGKGGDPKLLGVEMEAGGVCAAARKQGIAVSMIRVISDSADPAKADDHWRSLGMKTLSDLLKTISLGKIIERIP